MRQKNDIRWLITNFRLFKKGQKANGEHFSDEAEITIFAKRL